MSREGSQETAAASMVRALSLLLAILLWASVAAERPGQSTVSVPLRTVHLASGLKVASALPEKVAVTVRGPRILLWLLPYRDLSCTLDLSGASAGSASFTLQEDAVLLPDRELKVERIVPGCLSVALTANR